MFSHDPSALVARLMIDGGSTPPTYSVQPNFQVQDYEAFPSLQAQAFNAQLQASPESTFEQLYGARATMSTPPPGLNPFANFVSASANRSQSRPSSRHHSRAATPSAPLVDDNEAFPSLGSAASVKGGKRTHVKRGAQPATQKENSGPGSLADLVRMSPSPSPAQPRKGVRTAKTVTTSRENSAAAQAIPAPEHIPWLETGESANKAYLKARQEAFKHGGLRNKFLQR